MQIVIDIDENVFTRLFDNGDEYVADMRRACVAIRNGTPLPKGHGRLMILSEDAIKENLINLDCSCQKWISEISLSNATVAIIETESEERNV